MFEERVQEVFLSHIDASLDRLTEELTDMGYVGLDFSFFKQILEKRAANFFEDPASTEESDAADVVIEVGGVSEPWPSAFSRALVYRFCADFLEKMSKEVKSLGNEEISKVNCWMEMTYGEIYKIEWSYLRAVSGGDNDDELLGAARQVLEENPEKLQRLIGRVADDAEGMVAFIRDLGHARLESPEMEALLVGLMQLSDPEEIDLVIQSDELKCSIHEAPIKFLATRLKEQLKKAA